MSSEDRHALERERMVETQILSRGVTDPLVLSAMKEVRRHDFVPELKVSEAYGDHPVAIGYGQTISQPYMVALMTQLLQLHASSRVLEIGTGSGYQTAVLARITPDVYSLEIVPGLYEHTAAILATCGLGKDRLRLGDGYQGLPEKAPFDGIIVTAAPDHIPPALVEQLKAGGRLVIPVGPVHAVQQLLVLEKDSTGATKQRNILPVQFVPLTGEAQLPHSPPREPRP